jgi:hypothetical protein
MRGLYHHIPTVLVYVCVLVVIVGAYSASLSPEQTLITPSDARGDANFGNSLSIHNNSMVVGAPGDNSKGFNAGAVYMYDYISDVWSERSKLAASVTTSGDKFGITVNIFEDTLAVGAVNKLRVISGVAALQAGAVYIFLRSGNAWSESQQLLANDGQEYDHFGISVSLYQNALLIGASDDNVDASTSSGALFEGMHMISLKLTA